MQHQHTKRLALVLVLIFIMGLLTGCSAKSGSAASDSNSSPSSSDIKQEASTDFSPNAPTEAPGGNAAMDTTDGGFDAESAILGGESNESGVMVPADDPAVYAEKIIYSADLNIETTQFDQAVHSIEAMITEFGGFIESSNTWGNTQYQSDGTTKIVDRHANYTIRVPQQRFEEFLHQSGNIGNVTDTSRYAENITSRYTDQEARKVSLQTQEDRLLDMLSKATDVESLIMLESRLSEVRYELESIERTLRNWQMQVNYSTVTLALHEVALYTPTAAVTRSFGEKLSSALSDGWSGFVLNTQYFILSLVRNLPALLIFAVVIVAAVILLRKFYRSRKARRMPPVDTQSPNAPSGEDQP